MTFRSGAVTRRDFVRASTSGLASFALSPVLLRQRTDATLRLVVFDDAGGALARGISLGIREAEHAAALFNRSVIRLSSAQGDGWIERALREGAQGVLYAGRRSDAEAFASACNERGLVFLNASVADDRLRRERCGPFTFHVAASDAMLSDAARRASRKESEILMWHPSLVRFGAAQLNDRFRDSQGAPMTSEAWAGWMAVKIIWEAFLRAPSAAAPAIAEYLAAETTHFDGHKGVPLSFRSWDHQLRQPVYTAGSNGSMIEVPALSGPDASIRDLLDGIGDKQKESKCSAS